RLISRYKRFDSVEALLPRPSGRRRGTRVLSDELEAVIRTTIEEACRAPPWPTLTQLVEQVHARCRESNLPLPHRRTIKARLAAAAEREVPDDPSATGCRPGENSTFTRASPVSRVGEDPRV